MKRMLSGIRASGAPHIGNYFGAMKQFVELQDKGCEVFVFVANLHSLNSVFDKKELYQNTIDVVKDYLAIGLDPKKVTLFLQSDIPAHTELMWILSCLVTPSYLERSHAYKDAVANGRDVNMGLFNYPVLMAADILLYSPDVVPVGEDQTQHIEYARDIANKFNFTYGKEILKLPEQMLSKSTGTVPGIDGRKMSKSYKNHIPLFADDKEIKSIISRIVTDSKRPEDVKNPDECNIYNIYKLLATPNEALKMRTRYEEGGEKGIGYKEAKDILLETFLKYRKEMKEKRDKITDQEALEVLKSGAEKAKKEADKIIQKVREQVGIVKAL